MKKLIVAVAVCSALVLGSGCRRKNPPAPAAARPNGSPAIYRPLPTAGAPQAVPGRPTPRRPLPD